MRKKLTNTADERSHHEELGGPHELGPDLDTAYRELSQDERGEKQALEWAEGLIGDLIDVP